MLSTAKETVNNRNSKQVLKTKKQRSPIELLFMSHLPTGVIQIQDGKKTHTVQHLVENMQVRTGLLANKHSILVKKPATFSLQ